MRLLPFPAAFWTMLADLGALTARDHARASLDDVLLIRLTHDPLDAASPLPRSGRRVLLALGEATGHAHAIDSDLAELFEGKEGRRYVRLDGPCKLEHEEHNSILLTAGVYEVRIQREYVPEQPSASASVRD